MSIAASLREQFDRSFSQAPAPIVPYDDFLALRLGDNAYALALSDVASLHRDRKIVPLLQSAPHRLGIAGIRGVLAPVFDLRTLLGHSGGPLPRWLVLAAGPASVALAFDTFEGHLRVPQAEVSRGVDGQAQPHLRGTVLHAGTVRLIIHLASLLEAIRPKERS